MGEVTIVGVDLAKNVFQVHGAADGSVVLRKKLTRPQFARFAASRECTGLRCGNCRSI